MKIGGPNSKQEILFRKSYKELNSKIVVIEKRISGILIKAYHSPTAGAAYWNKVRRDLDIEYKKLKVLYTAYSQKAIPKAYRASMQELFKRLNSTKGMAKKASKTFSELVTSPRTLSITKALYNDAIADWFGALNAGQSNLERITRRTQQALVDQAIVNESVARAIESGNLLNNTFYKSKNLTNTLAAQLKEMAEIIDGEYYVIAGKKRFKPNYYAELVTRVKFHEAQAYGAMQTAANYGTSLVKVSYHNTTTEICQQYENMIFSMDGKDKRFPLLTETPPFHPNCLHNLFPVFAEAMEATGTLKQWEDFSKGTSQTPPAPKGFVPIDKRGDA